MNIEETKAAIAVMQAFVDGKKVEYNHGPDGWRNAGNGPAWDWRDTNYRIAPAPVVREMTPEDWRKLALSGVDYWVRNSSSIWGFHRIFPSDLPVNPEISFDLQTWQKPEVVDGKICGRVEV